MKVDGRFSQIGKLVRRQLGMRKGQTETRHRWWWNCFLRSGRNTGDNVRVCHGTSQASLPPPRTPCLAVPETFGDVELRPGSSCLLSKRDATCNLHFFHLKRYLDTTGDLKPDTILYPVSCCWPMCYSWSSFVGQSALLKCCLNAGLTRKHFLCMDDWFVHFEGTSAFSSPCE